MSKLETMFGAPVMRNDDNGHLAIRGLKEREPVNLRVAAFPYPHLRDDEGTILARDYVDTAKMAFILNAVGDAIAKRSRADPLHVPLIDVVANVDFKIGETE